MQGYPFPGNCSPTIPPTERRRDQILIQILHFRIEIQILVIASVTEKRRGRSEQSAGRRKKGNVSINKPEDKACTA